MKKRYQHHRLDNGLRILTAPMKHVQSVACYIMLAAGSRYETVETNGIAHFIEHMLFKGTHRRPTARDIATEVDAIGGEFNAYTSQDRTAYYIRCAAEQRPLALDVLADMILNSRFDPEEIEREKGAVLEEMNMYEDDPKELVGLVFDALLYGDQPLGWRVLGRKETIHAADRQMLLDYISRWYQPSRMVVGIAGRFEKRIVSEIEALFGDLKERETGEPLPFDAMLAKDRVSVFEKPCEQAHVCLGVASYPYGHPDSCAKKLLVTILGNGMSSRLFTEVREKLGLAYYVYMSADAYSDTGSIWAQAGVDTKRVDEAAATIIKEFGKIAVDPVSEEELQKAKSYTKGHFVLSLEKPGFVIESGLRDEVLQKKVGEPAEHIKKIDAVTVEDVQRVAQDLFRDGALRLAIVGPFNDPDRFKKLLQ